MESSTAPEHFIPLARSELIDLLCTDRAVPEKDRELFRSFCERVSILYHGEYHRRLQELKRDYLPFDPDSDTTSLLPPSAEQRQARLNGLLSDLGWLLERAGFKHLSRGEIEPALDRASDWGVHMDVDFGAFEHVAIFARGATVQTRSRRRWYRLNRLEEAEVPIYRRLVLVLKLRPHPRLRGPIDTQNVYLKLFKDIPKLDVLMLLPGASAIEPTGSRQDRSAVAQRPGPGGVERPAGHGRGPRALPVVAQYDVGAGRRRHRLRLQVLLRLSADQAALPFDADAEPVFPEPRQ